MTQYIMKRSERPYREPTPTFADIIAAFWEDWDYPEIEETS